VPFFKIRYQTIDSITKLQKHTTARRLLTSVLAQLEIYFVTVCIGGFDIQDCCRNRPKQFRGDASNRAPVLWKVPSKKQRLLSLLLQQGTCCSKVCSSFVALLISKELKHKEFVFCTTFSFLTFPQQKFAVLLSTLRLRAK
jgi:hypothetical protein